MTFDSPAEMASAAFGLPIMRSGDAGITLSCGEFTHTPLDFGRRPLDQECRTLELPPPLALAMRTSSRA